MTMPRSQLIDLNVTRYYHCISRCVRGAKLCGGELECRKQWIEDGVQKLATAFAIEITSFSVLENHFHTVVRLEPEMTAQWSPAEVARRWMIAFPPSKLDLQNPKVVKEWIQDAVQNTAKIQKWRQRLGLLSWFMKALKEPISRRANKQDGCRGAFWEGRFKSIAILDEAALMTINAYVELNPVAAGIVSTPEQSRHTSIRQRLDHANKTGNLENLKAAAIGSLAGSQACGSFEQSHWLCPIDDQRHHGAQRQGMFENFSLGSYLIVVDHGSRLCRDGKARVEPSEASIFQRLGIKAETWDSSLIKLLNAERLRGNYFASSRRRLIEVARQKGVHHLDNLIPVR